MGSTICVRCGETLIPYFYCDSGSTLNNNDYIYLEDTQKLVQIPNSSQIILNDDHNYMYYYFNDEIKYNSINLFTSYWEGIFYSIKLANRYWRKIFNIGNHNQYISWKQDEYSDVFI